jgi:hypothetical protein
VKEILEELQNINFRLDLIIKAGPTWVVKSGELDAAMALHSEAEKLRKYAVMIGLQVINLAGEI